jgi:hypothetical protein
MLIECVCWSLYLNLYIYVYFKWMHCIAWMHLAWGISPPEVLWNVGLVHHVQDILMFFKNPGHPEPSAPLPPKGRDLWMGFVLTLEEIGNDLHWGKCLILTKTHVYTTSRVVWHRTKSHNKLFLSRTITRSLEINEKDSFYFWCIGGPLNLPTSGLSHTVLCPERLSLY